MDDKLSSTEIYEGVRKVGVFSGLECIGYVIINIYAPDAFKYDRMKGILKVLVV